MKSQEFIAQALLEWLSNALTTALDVHRAGLPIMDVEYFLARLAQVAGFEPGQFSLALVGFGGSATDLEHLAAKYGLASLRGLSDDLYAAARWRNHRLAHGRILAFCAGRHPGVHTLQHFTRAGSRELAQALLKWARDQGGFPVSEPQRLLLHELATNQELMPLLSLEAVAEFLAAWQRCGEHDPADAPGVPCLPWAYTPIHNCSVLRRPCNACSPIWGYPRSYANFRDQSCGKSVGR